MLKEHYDKFEISMNKLKLFFLLVVITSQTGCNFFNNDNSIVISVENDQRPVESVVNTTKKPIQNDNKKNQEQYPNNFLIPIKDGCITDRLELLPGAPRTYRNGIHEGVDFYDGFSCVEIDFGTRVFAAAAGIAAGNPPPVKWEAGDPASQVKPCPATAAEAQLVPVGYIQIYHIVRCCNTTIYK